MLEKKKIPAKFSNLLTFGNNDLNTFPDVAVCRRHENIQLHDATSGNIQIYRFCVSRKGGTWEVGGCT